MKKTQINQTAPASATVQKTITGHRSFHDSDDEADMDHLLSFLLIHRAMLWFSWGAKSPDNKPLCLERLTEGTDGSF